MISGGTVQSDLSSLKASLREYSTTIVDLNEKWEGASYNNLKAKAKEFLTDYRKTIDSEMKAFSEACDLYKEYEKEKQNKLDAEKLYNQAVGDYNRAKKNDSFTFIYEIQKKRYKDDMQEAEAKMEELKTQIIQKLEEAGATKLFDEVVKAEVPVAEVETFEDEKFVTGEIDGTTATYLKYDENLIYNTLGEQGSGQCGVYSCAYGYTLLSGKCRVSGSPAGHQAVADAYNGGDFNFCNWDTMNLSGQDYDYSKDRLNDIWDEVKVKNKPCIVTRRGYYDENHYVLAIGFKEGATKENLTPSDIVVLDPARSGSDILHYEDNDAFDKSGYGMQIKRFPDNPEK